MAETISVLVLSEDETIETAISNAVSAIEETLCEETGHYQAKPAHPKDHPELYIGAHAETEPGQELINDALERAITIRQKRIQELHALFENDPIDHVERNPKLYQLCSSLGDDQSTVHQLFDATGHHTGFAIHDRETVDYIIDNNRIPVYIVKLLLK